MIPTTFLITALALTQSSAQEPVGWEAIRLDLEVTPVPEEGCLGIEGTMRLRRLPGGSPALLLALRQRGKRLTWVDVEGPAGAVVSTNEEHPEHDVLLARITPDETVEPGAEVEVAFFCEATSESGQFQVDRGIALASWVEGWYPFVLDDSVSLSKMMSVPGTTRFQLPPQWDAVSNGTLARRSGSEDGTSVLWEVTDPVARSFAAGPYRTVRRRVGEREIGIYLLPGTELDPGRQAELLAGALAAQERRFGPYPYPTYAIAEVPEASGDFYASSEQGFIMAKSSAFAWEHGNLPLWAHEMAHGWWGNLVGTDGPGSILCSESLAQYSAVIAIEALESEAAATEFLRFSRSGYPSEQCARGYFGFLSAGHDKPLAELTSGGLDHQLSDAKGHWVFHMLRRRLGDELFFACLRELIESHAHRDLGLQDLRDHFVRRAPAAARLERFFTQWLDRSGAPVVEAEWRRLDPERIELVLVQRQEEPFDLVVEVALELPEGSVRVEVELTEERTRTVVETATDPLSVRVDPDHDLLIWHPEYGDAPAR